jgi:hypothetical protein
LLLEVNLRGHRGDEGGECGKGEFHCCVKWNGIERDMMLNLRSGGERVADELF